MDYNTVNDLQQSDKLINFNSILVLEWLQTKLYNSAKGKTFHPNMVDNYDYSSSSSQMTDSEPIAKK